MVRVHADAGRFKHLALGAAALGAFVAFSAPSAQAASHYDCQVHGARPYPHRHIDPGDQMVPCDRPAQTGRYSTAARCVAHARRRGGQGRIVPGTQISSAYPLVPSDPAEARAQALNFACEEALAGCRQAADARGAYNAACEVIDRRFDK